MKAVFRTWTRPSAHGTLQRRPRPATTSATFQLTDEAMDAPVRALEAAL